MLRLCPRESGVHSLRPLPFGDSSVGSGASGLTPPLHSSMSTFYPRSLEQLLTLDT